FFLFCSKENLEKMYSPQKHAVLDIQVAWISAAIKDFDLASDLLDQALTSAREAKQAAVIQIISFDKITLALLADDILGAFDAGYLSAQCFVVLKRIGLPTISKVYKPIEFEVDDYSRDELSVLSTTMFQ